MVVEEGADGEQAGSRLLDIEALRAVEPTLDACSILIGPTTQCPVRLTFHLQETLRRNEPALRAALTTGIFELDALCRYGMVEVALAFVDWLPLGTRKGIRLAAVKGAR